MTYLLILLALMACMTLLDAKYRLFVFAQPIPALFALLGTTAMFLFWDVVAIAHGIFLHRESPLMTGVMIGHQLPAEEAFFLFFLSYQTMILVTGFLSWRARRASSHQGSSKRTSVESRSVEKS